MTKQQIGDNMFHMEIIRVCTKCRTGKPLLAFKEKKGYKFGRHSMCRICENAYERNRKKELGEIQHQKTREYYKKTVTRRKEIAKSQRKKHAIYIRKKTAEWRDKNREHVREYSRHYYHTHKEQCKQRYREYYANNIDYMRDRSRKYREMFPEKHREGTREWIRKNPNAPSIYNNNRRARTKGNGGTVTKKQWEKLLDACNYTCLWCHKKDVRLTKDHIIPISIGGINSIENIQPLCRSCNSKKRLLSIDFRTKQIVEKITGV